MELLTPSHIFQQLTFFCCILKKMCIFAAEIHSHLPGVPSAEEVERDGADLGEMNKVLLQKVEELTLYIIDLQKQLNELKSNQ